MAVPNLANALKGWTKRRTVWLISTGINEEGRKDETFESLTLDINIQPAPAEVLKRKPEEQWSWKWWSIIVKGTPNIKTQDAIIVDGIRYRIESVINWGESGFRKYEAVEDYLYDIPPTPPAPVIPTVTFGGSPVYFEEEVVTYAGT